ncbi:MAG: hypothetical protein JW767_01115 [Thermoleophilia bacterium]|nr:hypothetical protein [Thermoleophilia bacterium]
MSGRAAQGAAYRRLAGLGLVIDGYETERHELDVSSGFRRVTTTVVLRGGGQEGRGEDVTYVAEDHDGFPLDLPLSGHTTFDEYSRRFGELDLFPAGGPTMAGQETYRRWAFESAALDLALKQAGVSLGTGLAREYRPVRFVVSTRLDIRPWLEVDPDLEFKLDPTPEWDADTMARIAATGRVRALDFKAYYEGTPVDNAPDPELYRTVARAFPVALLEDPSLDEGSRAALRGEEGRFSFDAPIHSWADVEALPVRPRHLNVKPSRFGALARLLETIERAQAEGIELYGGGQFELGVGRDQIQALASLFYPDGPNDVAPRDFHGDARPGVPGSPLVPLEQGPGFGFAFRR